MNAHRSSLYCLIFSALFDAGYAHAEKPAFIGIGLLYGLVLVEVIRQIPVL